MIFHIFTCILYHSEYITNSQCDQLPGGLTAQLEEGSTGVVEVMGLNSFVFQDLTTAWCLYNCNDQSCKPEEL